MMQDALKNEFAKRCAINPSYSLRAFARGLGIHPAHLSLILSGKRTITIKTGRKIVETLPINIKEKNSLLLSLIQKLPDATASIESQLLSPSEYEKIQSWEHFAILELIKVNDFKPNLSWIASRLNISTGIALGAVNRLTALGFISIHKKKWVRTEKYLKTTSDIPSAAIREAHKNYLSKARYSLENHPVEEREFKSLTIALSKKDLPHIKKKFSEFVKSLYETYSGKNADDVYQLNLQLFPLKK